MMMGHELICLLLLTLTTSSFFSLLISRSSTFTSTSLSMKYQERIKLLGIISSHKKVQRKWRSLILLASDISDIFFSDGIQKSIIRSGNGFKYAKPNNTVEITWKMFRSDGSLAHDSDKLEEPFQFQVEASPSEVIRGWDLAVQTMTEGEISRFDIPAASAFGSTGVAEPISIAPNEDISCELQLIRIIPPLTERYKKMDANESIRDELLQKLQSESPEYTAPGSKTIHTQGSSSVTKTNSIRDRSEIDKNNQRAVKEVKFFDPAQDKLDPFQRVGGEGDGYLWEETRDLLDVKIPLPDDTTKSLLIVDIKTTRLDVYLIGQTDPNGIAIQTPLISGPLHGKILPSESSWAIVRSPLRPPYADVASVPVEFSTSGLGSGCAVGNCYLLLSLPKAYGCCDIWATVLDRDYLQQIKPVVSDEDDDVGNYGKYYQ